MFLRQLTQRPIFASFAVGLVALTLVFSRPLWYLPHPSGAGRADLLRWIALRDVTRYPRDLQVSLVDGLEANIQPEELSSSSASSTLIGSFADRIRENADVLKRVWFETRCERYASCPPDERMPYLLRRIDVLLGWSDVLEQTREAQAGGPSFLDEFTSDVQAWIDAAPSGTREHMQAAVRDAIVCWLATRDVARESLDSQQSLARIVKDHLTSSGSSDDDLGLPLDEQQEARLRSNAVLLIKAWLREQATRFQQATAEQRRELLDDCLATFTACAAHPYLKSAQESASAGLPAAMAEIPSWLESVEPDERASLSSFLQQLQGRVMAKMLKGFWGQP